MPLVRGALIGGAGYMMGRRAARTARAPDRPAAPDDVVAKLSKLSELVDDGVLTAEEFESVKARLLDEEADHAP